MMIIILITMMMMMVLPARVVYGTAGMASEATYRKAVMARVRVTSMFKRSTRLSDSRKKILRLIASSSSYNHNSNNNNDSSSTRNHSTWHYYPDAEGVVPSGELESDGAAGVGVIHSSVIGSEGVELYDWFV